VTAPPHEWAWPEDWHGDAVRHVTDADVGFVDPDNGTTTRHVASRSLTYVLMPGSRFDSLARLHLQLVQVSRASPTST
jgi:hypothetical protein